MAFISESYTWRTKDPAGKPIAPRQNLPVAAWSVNEGLIKKKWMDFLASMVARVVIPKLFYPGTMAAFLRAVDKPFGWFGLSVVPSGLAPALETGMARLIIDERGRRAKLKTRTGNTIDAMLIDRREKVEFATNGSILVIVCEGNYSFYEESCSRYLLAGGYSMLMWNHPGFGSSTGRPWPVEEGAAIDVVIQYAMFKLGWLESDLVVYGWSIGGYTATWAAMNYSDIRGLILDATFDDIYPLAKRFMPNYMKNLLTRAIRTHWNLDNQSQLSRYDGPVVFVRRSDDQIMCGVEPVDQLTIRRSNRINWLLKSVLVDRYPFIFTDASVVNALDNWLESNRNGRFKLEDWYGVEDDEWITIIFHEWSYGVDLLRELGWESVTKFPMLIGGDRENSDNENGWDNDTKCQIGLWLAKFHMLEFDEDHFAYLELRDFRIPKHPWDVEMAKDFYEVK